MCAQEVPPRAPHFVRERGDRVPYFQRFVALADPQHATTWVPQRDDFTSVKAVLESLPFAWSHAPNGLLRRGMESFKNGAV
jgi:hypothetical protein